MNGFENNNSTQLRFQIWLNLGLHYFMDCEAESETTLERKEKITFRDSFKREEKKREHFNVVHIYVLHISEVPKNKKYLCFAHTHAVSPSPLIQLYSINWPILHVVSWYFTTKWGLPDRFDDIRKDKKKNCPFPTNYPLFYFFFSLFFWEKKRKKKKRTYPASSKHTIDPLFMGKVVHAGVRPGP